MNWSIWPSKSHLSVFANVFGTTKTAYFMTYHQQRVLLIIDGIMELEDIPAELKWKIVTKTFQSFFFSVWHCIWADTW